MPKVDSGTPADPEELRVLTVLLRERDHGLLKGMAQRQGVSVSELVRRLCSVLEEVKPGQHVGIVQGQQVICQFAGL